jgi:PBSX family phage terminase large subunit
LIPSGLTEKQADSIAQSTARLNIWEGAVRSGKTVGSLLRWLEFIKYGPPGDILLCGKTERTLKRNIVNPLSGWLPGEVHYLKGSGELYIGDARRIEVVSAYDERSEGRIRGMTVAGAYGDELTLWPESFFSMLLSRMSVQGAKLFGTTNPDSPYHWLKTEYIDRQAELDLNVFHFGIDDNPYLDPAFIAALKREYTGLWYQRFISGLWVLAEGVVYDGYDVEKHLTSPHRGWSGYQHKKHIVGVDYGTSNPCTFGLYGWNTPGGRIVLEREYYFDSAKTGRQKTDSQYADDLEAFVENDKPQAVYVDPSAASFIVEVRKRTQRPGPLQGVSIRKGNNEVLEGIRFISGLLATGRYVMDSEKTTETQKEYSSYTWDPKAQKVGEDKPLKVNDHGPDRDRYALYSHFGRSRVISGIATNINKGAD